jgi:hypothetical protein
MFRRAATVPVFSSPVSPDWTIHDLLAWTGADDARVHDESLRPILSALATGLDADAAPGLIPQSPIALVRALGVLVRTDPGLRDRTLVSVAGVAAAIQASDGPRSIRRGAGPASGR